MMNKGRKKLEHAIAVDKQIIYVRTIGRGPLMMAREEHIYRII